MGDVYEARDRQLRRSVAVKLYRGTAPADRSRFDAEVVTLAALSHPTLVQVYDAGEHDGDGFVVLELVDGPTLRQIIAERGSLPADEVASLGAAMADALAYVHDRGVVHRDVTPANVLCGPDGRPRLADFGIARLLDTTRITATASAIGTAAYMAPEQVEGKDVTPAADVYALGLVLREALTGRAAYSGASHEVAMARLVTDPDVVTDIPSVWTPLLAAMTARDPALRPPAAEVARLISQLDQSPDGPPTVPVPAVEPDGAATQAAVAGLASVVVTDSTTDGGGAVDASAATTVLDTGGGTTVMPAILQPGADDAAPTSAVTASAAAAGLAAGGVAAAETPRPHRLTAGTGQPGGSRRALWLALAAIAAVLLLGLAVNSGNDLELPATSTTEPVVATVPTTAPTTTAPPTTPPPPREHGKGKGKHDD
jgi:hypothetical protein